MKSNSLSLNKIIKNSKIDFVSLAKYYLVTIGLILIAGIIIISVIGMKLGFDFKGGTVIETVYGVDANGTTYNETQAKDIIQTAISDYNLEISSCQTETSSFGDRAVFKLTAQNKLTNEQIAELKDDLYTMFNSYDEENVVQSQYIKVYNVEGTASNVAVYSSIALSVAIVLLALGVLVRYGLSQALATLLVSIINVLLVFAFVIIARIPVNTAFIASVFVAFFLTAISLLIYFDKVRENLKNNNYKGFTKNQHANSALRENFNVQVLLFGFSLICMILISGLGVAPIRNFGLPALFGVIVSSLSTFFAAPYLWTVITFNKIKRTK
jgi:preprotein translocase subunit SecF